MSCRVIVIGGGIMGLSAAWALRAEGHEVTLLEQGQIPNPLGSSVDQHRLIRFTYGAKLGYTGMVAAAYGAWERLWQALGERYYAPTGTLALAGPERDWIEDTRRTLDILGIGHESPGAEDVAKRWPMLVADDIEEALWTPKGGVLFADKIVTALAAHLQNQGVNVRCGCPVVALDEKNATVVTAEGEEHGGDIVVVAAGPWVARLLPALARRVTPSRQIVVYLRVPRDKVGHWAKAPMVVDLDPRGGCYMVPSDNGRAVKVGDHRFSLAGDPDMDRAVTAAETKAVADLASLRIGDFGNYGTVESKTCFYAAEAAERFIVEPIGPRGWVLAGFSGHGFKFGPLMGLKLAQAVSGSLPAADLTAWARGDGQQPFDDPMGLLEPL